jgi:hypothetical protein
LKIAIRPLVNSNILDSIENLSAKVAQWLVLSGNEDGLFGNGRLILVPNCYFYFSKMPTSIDNA